MTEPLTILLTAEDVDKAPKGTILCDLNEPYSLWMAAGIDSREAIVEVLPLRVLRWGKDHYPTGFAAPKLPTLADMNVQEREKCVLMQAEDGGGNLCVVLSVERCAAVTYKDWSKGILDLTAVTPRPDLPRLEWPSHEPEPEFSVGKMLETVEDFQNAPIGTVAIDADGDIIRREDEASWWVPSDPPTQDADDIHYWCSLPAKIITILGEQE